MNATKNIALLTVALLLVEGATADSLLEIYEKALLSDPQLREAEANRLAAREGYPQARGALLPQISGRANWSDEDSDGSNVFPQVLTSDIPGVGESGDVVIATRNFDGSAKGWNWTLELRQTLFRWDQWVRLKQADKQSVQADVDYLVAEQALITRVAQAYFNVLAAEDTLASEQAAKEAIGRQLEQAQKRFEVGLIAITDVQEAQAAYDQAVAAEILAKRALANQREALREIIGQYPPELAKPGESIPLVTPEPPEENQWVNTALQQNPSVLSSQIATEIAKDNVSLARTGHYPTVDLVLSRTEVDIEGDQATGLSSEALGATGELGDPFPSDFDTTQDSIGVQIQVPIFSGGTTSSQVREAVYRHRAAREQLQRVTRDTERQTRDAYLGVISEISRVQALKQALESARTALRATEAGYEVGTRTTVDVLDARRALFLAETNYLRSRYDYLLNVLTLKQAAGILAVDDLAEIDQLLEDGSGPATEAPTG